MGNERHGIYDFKDVIHLLQDSRDRSIPKRIEFDGIQVSIKSQRYDVFKQNHICVECGLVGSKFAAERSMSANDVQTKPYHFNLYAINENGEEVLMTKDHIIPKARGGRNSLNNYQTMCTKCNNLKADNIC